MASNRAVVYVAPGKVEVRDVGYPKMEVNGKPIEHGVILKVVSTNICGSDLHMVRGKTTAPSGLIMGHEITGEVVEMGRDVETLQIGDLVSVPFNVACGRCRNCKEGNTNLCLNTNTQPGGAYGYVDMGPWAGGQAEFVLCPYADFNLLKFPNKEQAMERIEDLTLLSDVFPTGYHGAVKSHVGPGTIVYVAGAGPVGLACAVSCQDLLGAACVIVGDPNEDRLMLAEEAGFETVDLNSSTPLAEQVQAITGQPEVDCFVDCVGYEAKQNGKDEPNAVLNQAVNLTRAGGFISLVGVYLKENPRALSEPTKHNVLEYNWGKAWSKALKISTGQCPVSRYNRQLMNAILYDRVQIADVLNVRVIGLDEAPTNYLEFERGAAEKLVIDPHNMLAA